MTKQKKSKKPQTSSTFTVEEPIEAIEFYKEQEKRCKNINKRLQKKKNIAKVYRKLCSRLDDIIIEPEYCSMYEENKLREDIKQMEQKYPKICERVNEMYSFLKDVPEYDDLYDSDSDIEVHVYYLPKIF